MFKKYRRGVYFMTDNFRNLLKINCKIIKQQIDKLASSKVSCSHFCKICKNANISQFTVEIWD